MKLAIVFCALLLTTVQSMYFYLERGQERCFKDEVVKNYVSNGRLAYFY